MPVAISTTQAPKIMNVVDKRRDYQHKNGSEVLASNRKNKENAAPQPSQNISATEYMQ